MIRPREDPLEEDTSIYNYVVQEPFEQAVNATFLLSYPEQSGKITDTRIKGLYYDDNEDEWVLHQRRDPITGDLLDMDLPGSSLDYHVIGTQDPETPSSTWRPNFTPAGAFSSGVYAIDASN